MCDVRAEETLSSEATRVCLCSSKVSACSTGLLEVVTSAPPSGFRVPSHAVDVWNQGQKLTFPLYCNICHLEMISWVFFFYPYKRIFYNYLNNNCFCDAFYVKYYLTGYLN